MSSIDTKHAVLTAHPSTPNHAVRSPGGARTIAKRELHQLKHRLQKLPSAARANDKPT
jgi:hypothetical protein